MHEIYALFDPRQPQHFRYVGGTARGVEVRVREHRCGARRGYDNMLVLEWIRQLRVDDIVPEHKVLETLAMEGDAETAERDWIAGLRLAGHALLNQSSGGESLQSARHEAGATKRRGRPRSPEASARQAQSLRDYYFRDYALDEEVNRRNKSIAALRRWANADPAKRDAWAAGIATAARDPERREKIRQSQLGTKRTPEQRRLIREAQLLPYQCDECDYVSTRSALGKHQRKRGHVGRTPV